jgi:hypothetical protein
MKLATDAHATWTDTHRQAFALAHDALGDGVDGFVYAETDEMKRAAINLRMIFFKGDVVIRVDKLDVTPFFGGVGGDAGGIGRAQKNAADPGAVGILEG